MNIIGPFWDGMLASTIVISTVGFLLKLYLTKSFKTVFTDMPEKIQKIENNIATIITKLEHLNDFYEKIHEHDTSIAVLEIKNGIRPSFNRPHKN